MQKSKIMFLAACGVMLMATSSAHALTRAEDAALKSCQIALQNNDAADRFYELDLGIGDVGKPMEIQRGIGWFMAQPDPMQAVKDWSAWLRRENPVQHIEIDEYKIRAEVCKGSMRSFNSKRDDSEANCQKAIKRRIDAIKANDPDLQDRKAADILIADVERGVEGALRDRQRNIQAENELRGHVEREFERRGNMYSTAYEKWKANAVANCGGLFPLGRTTYAEHLKCTGPQPTQMDYAKGGKYYEYNYMSNPTVEVNSLADLLNSPAYAKLDAGVKARVKADVEQALAERAAGMGPREMVTISHDGTGACVVDTCFAFSVHRQGESPADLSAAQQTATAATIAELGNAMNIPVHMRGELLRGTTLVVNVNNLDDLAGVTAGASIRKTLENCLAVATPGSVCVMNDAKYQFRITKDGSATAPVTLGTTPAPTGPMTPAPRYTDAQVLEGIRTEYTNNPTADFAAIRAKAKKDYGIGDEQIDRVMPDLWTDDQGEAWVRGRLEAGLTEAQIREEAKRVYGGTDAQLDRIKARIVK